MADVSDFRPYLKFEQPNQLILGGGGDGGMGLCFRSI